MEGGRERIEKAERERVCGGGFRGLGGARCTGCRCKQHAWDSSLRTPTASRLHPPSSRFLHCNKRSNNSCDGIEGNLRHNMGSERERERESERETLGADSSNTCAIRVMTAAATSILTMPV